VEHICSIFSTAQFRKRSTWTKAKARDLDFPNNQAAPSTSLPSEEETPQNVSRTFFEAKARIWPRLPNMCYIRSPTDPAALLGLQGTAHTAFAFRIRYYLIVPC